ncbi:hypothetical protein KCP78_04275 [Salmonella enterica subsp. enterica]|nr:hypothetical protein KCP78_04275 [Salmonella enterica subsp. enterica]
MRFAVMGAVLAAEEVVGIKIPAWRYSISGKRRAKASAIIPREPLLMLKQSPAINYIGCSRANELLTGKPRCTGV